MSKSEDGTSSFGVPCWIFEIHLTVRSFVLPPQYDGHADRLSLSPGTDGIGEFLNIRADSIRPTTGPTESGPQVLLCRRRQTQGGYGWYRLPQVRAACTLCEVDN
jgi:hypothetical protein